MKRSFGLLAGLTALSLAFAQIASAATTFYVTTTGTGQGTNGWADATNNLQGSIDAISDSSATNTVWVSNGVYEVGGVTNWPAGTLLTNRVAITKAITVRSANNDPTNTVIKGRFDTGAPGTPGTVTNGPAAVRCVYMIAGSSLIGFTLTNGATLTNASGGGVYCPSTSPIISNCVLAGNSAVWGGGVAAGTLYNCQIVGNSAKFEGGTWDGGGGGAVNSALYNCRIVGNSAVRGGGAYIDVGGLYNCMIVSNSVSDMGGGAKNGVASNCTFIGNSSPRFGGGASDMTLYNCLLAGNSGIWGGGVYKSSLYNCTIVSNSAAGGQGGGVMIEFSGTTTVFNCIIYFNTATSGSNWYHGANCGFNFTNSCTAPSNDTGWAVGNITSDPMLVGLDTGNYHLRANSPCVNAGAYLSWMTGAVDLNGHSRIDRFSGRVDMGAYEYLPSGTIFRGF